MSFEIWMRKDRISNSVEQNDHHVVNTNWKPTSKNVVCAQMVGNFGLDS